ncbi:hypothetical protein [Umezawaea beigongshangensis]|nr:hypothetical protein [Umezawaea beigongshangensis]
MTATAREKRDEGGKYVRRPDGKLAGDRSENRQHLDKKIISD